MLGIVLSGGGSKGAYEIGVWKAIRRLGLKYDIVTGTSVGALNAALMCQNKYYKAVRFWKRLSFSDVIDEKIDENNKKQIYKTYLKGALKGGVSINNLESTVDRAISVKKIYKSKINIGIITFNLKTLKPLKLIKRGIPRKQFKNYLIASASCFPAFTKKVIDGNTFVDGGIYDNLPINLAIDMGASEIIAVDLKEIGIKQKIKNTNIPVTLIEPKNDIGSFLIFDSKNARRAIRLGYNDTLKKFQKLEGNKYTFKNAKKYYKKKINTKKMSYQEFINTLEILGYALEIDDSYIYSLPKFNRLLLKRFKQIEEEKISKKTSYKIRIGAIKYIYNRLDSENKYIRILKKEYLCALYLKQITNKQVIK